MKPQEIMEEIVYNTLKENGIGIGQNRAFITDIVGEALWKAGYRKLPEDKPPLVPVSPQGRKAVQAQREEDIKHYGG